jgi:hypothetical protein
MRLVGNYKFLLIILILGLLLAACGGDTPEANG